jgi:hypothetical protein
MIYIFPKFFEIKPDKHWRASDVEIFINLFLGVSIICATIKINTFGTCLNFTTSSSTIIVNYPVDYIDKSIKFCAAMVLSLIFGYSCGMLFIIQMIYQIKSRLIPKDISQKDHIMYAKGNWI